MTVSNFSAYSDRYNMLCDQGRDADLFLRDIDDGSTDYYSPSFVSDAVIFDQAVDSAIMCDILINESGFDAAYDYFKNKGLSAPGCDQAWLAPRLICADFWKRQLMRKHDRDFEHSAIKNSFVNKHSDLYVSQDILTRVVRRQKLSREMMLSMTATSNQGDEVSMIDLLAGSVSNPEIRRAELMLRMRGFEDHAEKHNHVGVFYTITTPSKYHAVTASGRKNNKYQGATPKQTQKYLTDVWARIRSAAKRRNLTMYGFRVAEPHHDGTPHWHMLLFTHPDHKAELTALISDYAMAEDSTELGAKKYRFEAVDINKDFGSATGYIAKYISKNIDGFEVGEDYESKNGDASDTSERVRAWSSVWGIRQFQQIGGAPVGVWRELRKCRSEIPDNEKLELMRVAADTADWLAYLELQGGAASLRKNQSVRISSHEFDTETGEVFLNKYGESVSQVKGLFSGSFEYITRTKTWTIDFISGASAFEAFKSVATRSSVNNCTLERAET